MEKYRTELMREGLYKVLDVPIFAVGERKLQTGKKLKWTREDLEKVAERYQRSEKQGFRPSIFVGHSDGETRTSGDRPAVGTLSNIRVAEFYEAGKKKAGLIADFLYIDEETLEALEHDKFPGRSIEINFESKRVFGLALLGRTPPHFELPQKSVDPEEELIELYSYNAEIFSMQPQAPQAPATAPGGKAPMIIQQITQLLQSLAAELGGQGQPQQAAPNPAPAPAQPSPAAKFETTETDDMDNDRIAELELKIEFKDQVIASLEAKIAAFENQSEDAQAEAAQHKFDATVAKLTQEGYVVDETSFKANVEKFGYEDAASIVRKGPKAPIKSAAPNREKAVQVEQFNAEADEEASYGALAPSAQKQVELANRHWNADPQGCQINFGDLKTMRARYIAYPDLFKG